MEKSMLVLGFIYTFWVILSLHPLSDILRSETVKLSAVVYFLFVMSLFVEVLLSPKFQLWLAMIPVRTALELLKS